MDREAFLKSCGILPKWHKKTFKQFTNDKAALREVQNFLKNVEKDNSNIGLYIYGSPGVGKTHLAICAMLHFLENKKRVKVVTTNSFCEEYKSYKHQSPLVMECLKCDVLLLENFGKEYRTGKLNDAGINWVSNTLEYLLAYRNHANKATWVTSQISPENIKVEYSDGVVSLLKESAVPLKIRGEDFRESIQDRNLNLLN